VNGEKIYAADVARQAGARGQTAAQALDELIAAELLAQEAWRRGLDDDPEVAMANKRERVRLFIQREFEPTFDGPEDIPQADIDKAMVFPKIRILYDHEAYRVVAWVRAAVPKKSPPEVEAAAKAAAAAFTEKARAARPADPAAFFALARSMPAAPARLEVADKQVFSTTLKHGPAQDDFAACAFTLNKVGENSAPCRTPWGWDVLFLKETLPETHVPRAEAEADLRTRFFEDARRDGYLRWVDGIVARHQVTKNPALVDAVQVDSVVGL
jgi:hypothetical protein